MHIQDRDISARSPEGTRDSEGRRTPGELAENEVVSDKTVVEAGFDVCKGDSIGGVFWRCSMTNWMQERRFLR